MSETRLFPTLDVITVSTGILVSDGGIGAVYELAEFMLGDTLMTHQLPAASRTGEPELIRQHPWLAEVNPPRGDTPALKAWCAAVVAERGETLPVASIDSPAWVRGNALADLEDIRAGKPIIGVAVDEP